MESVDPTIDETTRRIDILLSEAYRRRILNAYWAASPATRASALQEIFLRDKDAKCPTKT